MDETISENEMEDVILGRVGEVGLGCGWEA